MADQPIRSSLQGVWTDYQHQENQELAKEYFLKYAKRAQNVERVSLVYYQLGINHKEKQLFSKAQSFFETITLHYSDSPLYTASLFWRAEMAYAANLGKKKKEQEEDATNHEKLSIYYHDYLKTEDTTYLPITYFRIGTLSKQSKQYSRMSFSWW